MIKFLQPLFEAEQHLDLQMHMEGSPVATNKRSVRSYNTSRRDILKTKWKESLQH